VKCKKKFQLEEIEGDHIKPWHEGGKTNAAKPRCSHLLGSGVRPEPKPPQATSEPPQSHNWAKAEMLKAES